MKSVTTHKNTRIKKNEINEDVGSSGIMNAISGIANM